MSDIELRQTLLDLVNGYRELARIAERETDQALAANYYEVASQYEKRLAALDAGADPLTVISMGQPRLVS